MSFSKQLLSDEDWAGIDFDTLNLPKWNRPARPRDWVADGALGVAMLPATDHNWARDGLQRFLLIDKDRATWLHFGTHPPSPIRWSLWLGATADEIQRTQKMMVEALSVYLGDSFNAQLPIVEFQVKDPFHKETFEELLHRFNVTTTLALAAARLRYSRYPDRDARKKGFILDNANTCFTEDQKTLLLNHFWSNGTAHFDQQAITTLVWLSGSRSFLFRLRVAWHLLFSKARD